MPLIFWAQTSWEFFLFIHIFLNHHSSFTLNSSILLNRFLRWGKKVSYSNIKKKNCLQTKQSIKDLENMSKIIYSINYFMCKYILLNYSLPFQVDRNQMLGCKLNVNTDIITQLHTVIYSDKVCRFRNISFIS